jgi:hypothetical protein
MSSWLLCQHIRGSIKRKLPAFAVNCKGYFYARMRLFLEEILRVQSDEEG